MPSIAPAPSTRPLLKRPALRGPWTLLCLLAALLCAAPVQAQAPRPRP